MKTQNTTEKLLAILASLASLQTKGVRMASLTYTAKGTGEVARHTLALGVSITNAYKRDVAVLTALRPTLQGMEAVACDELLASMRESLAVGVGNNSAYVHSEANANTYQITPIKGVKIHKETGEIHVSGMSRQKKVLQEGIYKTVKSSEKTLAKNRLRKLLKSGRIRQFVLAPNVESVRMDGKTLSLGE